MIMNKPKRARALLPFMMAQALATPLLAVADAGVSNDSRFYEADGVILDFDQHIYWQKCSMGQVMVEGRCEGKPERMALEDAVEVGNKAEGWRLPTTQEYRSVALCRHPTGSESYQPQLKCTGDYLMPTVSPIFGWISPVKYWSHTPGEQAATFSFYTGETIPTLHEQKHMVILVRDFGEGVQDGY